jgi:hypothetical protein
MAPGQLRRERSERTTVALGGLAVLTDYATTLALGEPAPDAFTFARGK